MDITFCCCILEDKRIYVTRHAAIKSELPAVYGACRNPPVLCVDGVQTFYVYIP